MSPEPKRACCLSRIDKILGAQPWPCSRSSGYRGHNYPDRFKVWISGQVRRVTKAIRREMRRRAAVKPVIGDLKEYHRVRIAAGNHVV